MTELIDRLRDENERLLHTLVRCSAALNVNEVELAARQTKIGALQTALARIQQEHDALVVRLTTELLTLKRQLFGPKAERLKNAEAQQSLFDILHEIGRLGKGDVPAGERAEAMLGETRDELEANESDESTSPRLPAAPLRKPKKTAPHGRRKLDESKLPVVPIVLEPLERKMPGGELLVKIGEEISSHLDYRPSSVVRVEVHRPKYVRPEEAGTSAAAGAATTVKEVEGSQEPAPLVRVLCAEPPELPIAKGLAGPALLALVLVMKYADHLPLNRQERIFKRQGVHLPRSTLCGFVQGCVELLQHVVDAMWEDAKQNSPILLTDACGVLILQKERCRRGAFQVFIAPARHVLFAYLKENNGAAVAKLLEGFAGKLQSDAAAVYHETHRQEPSIVEVGCWAHGRRGFFKAMASDRPRALVGIGFIGALYDAHNAARDPETGVIDQHKRKLLAQPVLDDLKAWLERERPKLVPTSPIEVAMGYLQRQWIPLTRFLDDGSLRLDNNPSELELRHQVVGRKNWLFCASDGGANWNAVVVSLIASCRMHDIEPHAYLRDILILLPSWDRTRVLELSPALWKKTAQEPEILEKLKRLKLLPDVLADHDAVNSGSDTD